MKKLTFKTENEFLHILDGKVYSIADATGEKHLCDLLEEDFIQLCDENKIIDLESKKDFDKGELFEGAEVFSYTILASKSFENEVLDKRVEITVLSRK